MSASARLRLAFMGSPDFAVPTLEALIDAGHDIVCVYTQPPKPAGRGKKMRPTPVQRAAEARGIEARTPRSLKPRDAQRDFAALDLDAAIVAAYGLILPQAVLDAPRLGCINLHGSLLPRWRGAAPIQRAIMAGDEITGVQAMIMDAGLDTGPVLATETTRIFPFDTAGDLHDRLAELGAELMPRALAGLAEGRLAPKPQAVDGATYANKITADDLRIDWTRPAAEVDRQIRGLAPAPGAWFEWTPRGEAAPIRMKALLSSREDQSGPPGQLLDDALLVACGDGAVRLRRVQRPGRGPMDADAFLRGSQIAKGDRFG
ncbi:MAG: methionyl-tRNA formyltransferase [Pseudomonadota bacterium]